MIGIAPSKELEKWIVYDLYNIHLKKDAPESVKEEFDKLFKQDDVIEK